MHSKRPSAPEDDISWRTKELGPEMRRRLFEKVLPSASPGSRREGPAPTPKDVKHSDRPKAPKPGHK